MRPFRIPKKISLVVFDLDGTLAESKRPIDAEMRRLLSALLERVRVAVIGGGKFSIFKRQVLGRGRKGFSAEELSRLFLFPGDATVFYRLHQRRWRKVYEHPFSSADVARVREAFSEALPRASYVRPVRRYGIQLENRGTQMTFSALGQHAPLAAKLRWNKKSDIRPRIVRELKKMLPRFEAQIGGLTSIDVMKKGIDKAYGIRQMEKHLHVPRREMFFVGDALFPGGNDYAVKKAGVVSVQVGGPKETKTIIKKLLREL